MLIYVYVNHIHAWCLRELDALELVQHRWVVNHHMDAENGTRVLKNSQCLYLLYQLSSSPASLALEPFLP